MFDDEYPVRDMTRSVLAAAAAYFGSVFAVGFVLGTVRVLVTAPAFGQLAALLIELTIMLVVSWFASAYLARRFQLGTAVGTAVEMGAIAFLMLMVAEGLLGLTLFRRSWVAQLDAYGASAGLIGLSGQVAFGLMPILQSVLYQVRGGRVSRRTRP